jgi:H+/Cl- antiporter ClcA/CBS domain-containing protein
MSPGGDFTADRRLIWIAAIAAAVGAVGAGAAFVLFRLICLFTNLFFYQRFAFVVDAPGGSPLGWAMVVPPIVGGLVVGLIARFGSERIRGHGIPEAMEAILIGRSRMDPKIAVLKPLSSAIAIGSGGPFGAEGPIIMTGGAIGSIVGQLLHVTAAERKTLLVAGAAAGMSATFGTPVAAVLLAVELLLFEWKPRSLVPVVAASAVAAALRPYVLASGPLFPLAAGEMGLSALAACVVVGLLGGMAAQVLTWSVYAAEDAFHRLPLHWMWWPAIGGAVVGLGGMLEPRALGVGYSEIEALVAGHATLASAAPLLVVKAVIWVVALSSGTSGGVLAPLLMMGGALGVLETPLLPASGAALWPLVSLAAVMGSAMRSPLTAIVFALELTRDTNVLLPVMIAAGAGYAFVVLTMRRSILTAKVARRGYHVSSEYSVDPLDSLAVGDVMTRDVVTVPASLPVSELESRFFARQLGKKPHQGYPVVDAAGQLCGVVTRSSLIELARNEAPDSVGAAEPREVGELIERSPIVAYADESCRTAAERLADAGVGRLPVVRRTNTGELIGIVSRSDLLKARSRTLELERRRERMLRLGPREKREPSEPGASLA